MCFRTSRSSVHAPRPVSGDSHCQLWTHHARQLLAEVSTADAYMQNRFRDHKLIVCVVSGISRLCSWRSKDASSVFEVTPATTWKMESFCVLFVNVWATLWSLSCHTQRHPTTGASLSLTWGLTETHWTHRKPNDASLFLLFWSVSHPSLEAWLKVTSQQIAALHSFHRTSSDGRYLSSSFLYKMLVAGSVRRVVDDKSCKLVFQG